MDAGKPDPEEAPRAPESLSQRLASRLRAGVPPAAESRRGTAALVAVLIAFGPLATIMGAGLLTRHEDREAVRLRAALAPRIAAERAAAAARAELGRTAARPTMGATLDLLAAALPGDAKLTRAERTLQGALELDIATSDPDALRSAIRRVPELAGLRDTSQRRTDAAMIVLMRAEAP